MAGNSDMGLATGGEPDYHLRMETQSPLVTSACIESTPGVCGGKPRIAGTRIRVQDVVIWHERLGLSADEIASRFPHLTLASIYVALAYYHEHRDEIHMHMEHGQALVEELKRAYPSKVPMDPERDS